MAKKVPTFTVSKGDNDEYIVAVETPSGPPIVTTVTESELRAAANSGNTLKSALTALRQRNDEIDTALEPIAASFQRDLLILEGRNFESLEANQQVAQLIQDTADRLRVAFSCPKCGESARFRCAKNASMKNGMFTFAHSVGTHTGTATIPKLTLVAKPEHGLREKVAEIAEGT